MKSYNSRELFKLAKQQGFRLDRIRGSHHIFINDDTKAVVVIPHPRDSYKPKTQANILKGLGFYSPLALYSIRRFAYG